MIETNQLGIIFILLILIIILWLKGIKQDKKISILNAYINCCEKENNELKDLQKNINMLEEDKNIYLKAENKRCLEKTKVSNEEINYIVNHSNLNYKIDMCHINALNAFIELGDENANIMIGVASYLGLDGKEKIATNHLWNEYKYFENGEKTQLIDSINYKKHEKKKYFNHKGIPLNLYNYIDDKKKEVLQLIYEKKFGSLTTYPNDDKDSVY